jgi:hypothetical protein
MAVKVQSLRSSTASKRPTTLALLDGEIALNTNTGTPGLFFEDSAGVIVKVGPAEVGGSAPNAAPASGGSAGNSPGEFWFDTANAGPAGNGEDVLKVYTGATWSYIGKVTIGSTNIELGAAATTSLAGLTAVTSASFNATSDIDLENQADLRFYEATVNGSNYVGFQAPSTVSADVLWTLPAADGTSGQVLSTDGAGVLSWSSNSTNSISQGDSSVTVTDTGTNGNIAFATEGSTRWNINSNGHFVPGTDSTYNIGASGNEVSNIFVDTLTSQVSAVFNGDVDLGNATSDSITFTGRVDSDVNPIANNSYKLGSSGLVWSEVHATSLYGSVQEVTVLKSLGTDSGTATATAQTITISGGTGLTSVGSGTSVTINLDNTSVVAASYGSSSKTLTATVDAQGRLTALADTNISITASQVSDFDTQVRTNRLDQMAAPTAPVSFNNQRITNVAEPVLPSDAATKQYADSIAQSLNVHGAADYATTGTVSYSYTSGGTALTITDITGTDTITFSANHGLSLNSQIRTGDTTTGTGLATNTTFYVVAIPALNQVKVSSTFGGPIYTLTNGSGLSIGVTGNPGVSATLTGTPDTIDSSPTLTVGLRILVKNHTTAAYNGIYTVTTVGTGANGVWTRAADFDNGPTGEITAGDYVFVANGTVNGGDGFVQTDAVPIRMGISGVGYTTFSGDPINWTQFSGAGQIDAGQGLSKTGNTLDVNVDNVTLEIVSDNLQIKSTYIGQSSITTLGTITTGTWNGTAIGLAYGGTGGNNTAVAQNYAFIGPNTGGPGNATFREILTSDVAPITGGSWDAGTY